MKREPCTEPFTAAELRLMFARGDSVSTIHARARRLDRTMRKDDVRAILFDTSEARS